MGSANEFDPQAEAAEVAAVFARHIQRTAARKLAALCRSRLLERRIKRLRSTADCADLDGLGKRRGIPIFNHGLRGFHWSETNKESRNAAIPDRSFTCFLDFPI